MAWFDVQDAGTFAISAASLIVYYVVARTLLNRYHSKRNTIDRKEVLRGRSWLLSLAVAVVLTVEGVAQCISIASHMKGTGTSVVDLTNEDDPTTGSRAFTIFFIVFCALDLTIGVIDYRSQLAILTGWVHHTVYISMLIWFCAVKTTVSFTLFGILELPTAVLAIGSIYKPWRMDMTFGITFLSTRILYMGAIWVLACMYSTPFRIFLITAMMCLHLYWFYGWVVGMLKKGKKGSGGRRGEEAGKDSDTSSTSTDGSSLGSASSSHRGADGDHEGDGDQSSSGSAPPSPLLVSKDGLAVGTGRREERVALMSTHRDSEAAAASSSSASTGSGSQGMDPLSIGVSASASAAPLSISVLVAGEKDKDPSPASALAFVPPAYSPGSSTHSAPTSPSVAAANASAAAQAPFRHSAGGIIISSAGAPLSARSDSSGGSGSGTSRSSGGNRGAGAMPMPVSTASTAMATSTHAGNEGLRSRRQGDSHASGGGEGAGADGAGQDIV